MPDQPAHAVQLRGESDTLRALMAYEAAADPEHVIALARRALAATPRTWYYVRSVAWLYLAAAYQMAGSLDRRMRRYPKASRRMWLRTALCAHGCGLTLLHRVMAGDLAGDAAGRPMCLLWARHTTAAKVWAGALFAQQRRLPAQRSAGCRGSREGSGGLRYVGRPMAYLQGAFIYALIHQARGLPDQARRSSGWPSIS